MPRRINSSRVTLCKRRKEGVVLQKEFHSGALIEGIVSETKKFAVKRDCQKGPVTGRGFDPGDSGKFKARRPARPTNPDGGAKVAGQEGREDCPPSGRSVAAAGRAKLARENTGHYLRAGVRRRTHSLTARTGQSARDRVPGSPARPDGSVANSIHPSSVTIPICRHRRRCGTTERDHFARCGLRWMVNKKQPGPDYNRQLNRSVGQRRPALRRRRTSRIFDARCTNARSGRI